MKRDITQFKTHVDNVNETISAKDVNAVNRSVNQLERNMISTASDTFVNKAFYALENNIFVNSMFLDEFKTPQLIFKTQSKNIIVSPEEQSVSVITDSKTKEGMVQSIYFQPKHPVAIDKVILLVDEYLPQGSKIEYFVATDLSGFYPIKHNSSTITELDMAGEGVFIRARLIKNKYNESPKIFGWAILYKDTMLDKLHGLGNIDLTRDYSTNTVGDTILVRDRGQGDKLIGVIEPGSSTELYYDDKDRLAYTIERIGDKTTKETLNYGMYLNSQNTYEETLLGTTKELIMEPVVDGDIPEYVEDLEMDGDI